MSVMAPFSRAPWHAYPLFLSPQRIAEKLAQMRARGIVDPCPNLWQLELGVLRMWHRALFRSDTIGTCRDHPPRRTWRARLLANRVVRGPFLLAERAIAPWDMTGLFSSKERIIRHLLGAHHDRRQCAYDFSLLQPTAGALEELRRRLVAIVDGTDPRAAYLRDLCVYENYHEELLLALDSYLRGDSLFQPEEWDDPDIRLEAWLRWCARQPASPAEWWNAVRAGEFAFVEPAPPPTHPFPTDPRVHELITLGQSALLKRFSSGYPVSPDALPRGWYRGVSLGLPRWVERLSWKTFVKVVEEDAQGRLWGRNIRLEQQPTAEACLSAPLSPKRAGGRWVSFGEYGVGQVPGGQPGAGSALIDYRLGSAAPLDPLRMTVDPLVALTPGDPTVLLGRSYVVVGAKWVPTPTWFVLQYAGPPLNEVGSPSRDGVRQM